MRLCLVWSRFAFGCAALVVSNLLPPSGLVEYLSEPLFLTYHLSSPHSSGRTVARVKKTPQGGVSKSPSKSEAPLPVNEPASSEVSQALDWRSSASQCAKTQPEMAYKLFARAGQVFARSFRTRDAAACYLSVIQLQHSLLSPKLAESSISRPSLLDIATHADPSSTTATINDLEKSIIASISVLFKSYLYLARLFRPYDTTISMRMFWNCLETVIPSSTWQTLNAIFPQTSTNNSNIELPRTSPSIRDYASTQCADVLKKVERLMKFIDAQRAQAAIAQNLPNVILFTAELATICRELSRFSCAREASYMGYILLEMAVQIETFSVDDSSCRVASGELSALDPHSNGINKQNSLANIEKDLLLQAVMLSSLGHQHWHIDCLLQIAALSESVDTRMSSLFNAITISVQLGTPPVLHDLLSL